MDRPVIDIPGYYFGKSNNHDTSVAKLSNTSIDKEKKKYFKIQRGSPASVAYSAQDVKRRKTREEKSDEAQLAIDRQKGRIRRSKGLTESLAGGILAREQGKGALQSTEVYARGLLAQGHLPLANVRDPLFIVEYRPDLGPSRLTVGIGMSHLAKTSSDSFIVLRGKTTHSHRYLYRSEYLTNLLQQMTLG